MESIPGKVSFALLLRGTRLPANTILGNFDAFRDEGLSHEAAIAEVLDCYPEAGMEMVHRILYFRDEHQLEAQR